MEQGNWSHTDTEKPFTAYTFDKYCKSLAKRCGFHDYKRFTSRGARSAGITSLATSAVIVPPVTIMNHAGHKNMKTNLIYARETKAGNVARQAAIMNKARHPNDRLSATNTKGINNVEEVFCKRPPMKTSYVGYNPFMPVPFVPMQNPYLKVHPTPAKPTIVNNFYGNVVINNNKKILPVQNPYEKNISTVSTSTPIPKTIVTPVTKTVNPYKKKISSGLSVLKKTMKNYSRSWKKTS